MCEDHILNTGGGLVSRGYLEEVYMYYHLNLSFFIEIISDVSAFKHSIAVSVGLVWS